MMPHMVEILHGWEAVPRGATSDTPHGFGRTRVEALHDLLANLLADCDPALDQTLVHMREVAHERALALGQSAEYRRGLMDAFGEIMRAAGVR